MATEVQSPLMTSADRLAKYIVEKGEAAPLASARQEYLENLFNTYC